MTSIHSRTNMRSAFTMIELMVVLLIIAILASLLFSAVMRIMGGVPQVQTATEITQLSLGLQAFMRDYNLTEPPPSYLVLYENLALYQGPNPIPNALQVQQSYAFLTKAFGRNLGSASNGIIDWNGDGIPGNGPNGPTTPWILEGEQCLVFYLGGIPTAPWLSGFAPQGFSTNNMNPAFNPPGIPQQRKGPYYQFQTNRLVSMQSINPLATSPQNPQGLSPLHPVYLDAWQVKNRPYGGNPHGNGWPYAFFSSRGLNNGYTITDCANLLDPTDQTPVPQTDPLFNRCQFYNMNNPLPYSSNQYLNSNMYQILSAGKDGVFGLGTMSTAGGEKPGGDDDQSNFSSTTLGKGQN